MPNFPPFHPDKSELNSGTLLNVIMREQSFAPTRRLAAVGGAVALPAAPRGAVAAVVDGSFHAFVATDTELYKMDSGFDWDDLGATLDAPEGHDHSMVQFGVYLILTNTSDGMFGYNIQTPAGVNAITQAPSARVVFQTNNLLVGLCNGSDFLRIKTSAQGDHTNWTTKGSTSVPLQDGEELTAGGDIGGGIALIGQKNMLRRMVFNASPGGGPLYGLQKVAEGVGPVHARSFVVWNGAAFFYHQNGFYMSVGGQVPKNIGSEKVNNWFAERCADATLIYGVADPRHTRIRYRYKSVDCLSDAVFEDIIDYNWRLDEWVPCTERTSALFQMAVPGKTLEDLDAFGNMETLAYSLDSPIWAGDTPNLAGLDEDKKFGFFSGGNAAATLETNTLQGPVSMMINSATPITDDLTATVSLGVKDRVGDSIAWKDPASIQTSGRVPLRGRGKLYRFRLSHAEGADWTNSNGIEGIDAKQGGPR